MFDKTIEQLLGSKARVRTLRLFLRNPAACFTLREISQKTKLPSRMARREIVFLAHIRFLSKKTVRVELKRKRTCFVANTGFPLWGELQALLLKSSPVSFSHITSELRKLGGIQLAVLGGMFINQDNARADMLIVAKRPSPKKFKGFIGSIEAESGKDINCVVISPAEFKYRYDLFDHVVRDMLASQNIRLIDRVGM